MLQDRNQKQNQVKPTIILNLSKFKTCQQVEIETKFSLAPKQPTQLKFNQFLTNNVRTRP